MMERVFAEFRARGIDHDAALVVAERVEAPLDVLDQVYIFGAEHVAKISKGSFFRL